MPWLKHTISDLILKMTRQSWCAIVGKCENKPTAFSTNARMSDQMQTRDQVWSIIKVKVVDENNTHNEEELLPDNY